VRAPGPLRAGTERATDEKADASQRRDEPPDPEPAVGSPRRPRLAIVLVLCGRVEATRVALGTDTLRTAFMQWRSGEPRAAAESRRRAPRFGAMRSRTAAWGSQSRRRPRARSGALSGRLRGRRQPQGRLSGLVNAAAGVLSSRQQRQRSTKGPAALALVAGAAGVAVVKRRRSAAANEPTGEVFAGAEHKTGAQTARADRPAQEPPTAPQPDAERESGASGGGSSESKEGLE
jgi:hypothetical protein